MYEKKVKGFICMGQNPAVDSPNAKMARQALRNLEWMVVVDLFETDTAAVWKEPGIDPKSSQVEVFYIPGAPAAEKDRSEEHTSELQSLAYLVCRLLLEKKKKSKCDTRLRIQPTARD